MNYTILTVLIVGIIVVAAGFVVVYPWLKTITTEKQQKIIDGIYKMLVFAAEQIFGDGKGKEKKDYVVNELVKRGYTVDYEKIESMVWEYLNSGKTESDKTETEE